MPAAAALQGPLASRKQAGALELVLRAGRRMIDFSASVQGRSGKAQEGCPPWPESVAGLEAIEAPRRPGHAVEEPTKTCH
jgi:hypothetical protein